MEETKICKGCLKDLPLSNFEFRKDIQKYRPACKGCKRVKSREQIKAEATADAKSCNFCGEIKDAKDFKKGHRRCKVCEKQYKAAYYQANKERLLNKFKGYYKENSEKIKKQANEYRQSNPEVLKKRKRKYYDENKDKIVAFQKRYYESNPEKVKQQRAKTRKKRQSAINEWNRNKRANDISFKIEANLRGRIYVALKRGVRSATTVELLGCSIEYFKKYIEAKFEEGMSWKNYKHDTWHIDHIRPCSSFNLSEEIL